uniref:interferon phi 3 n=1 Tax=Scatophagus argus TaxID=75038 RepID=UPI001ED84E17|nr:interferon phi 3 [Scatophagus argus]XP_046272203.1 interferon phi 3 [Scatophagus argus]
MMLPSFLLILLQVCSLQLMVAARPSCRLRADLVQSAHQLLLDLGGDFPVRCLPYNANISFPVSIFSPAAVNQPQCCRALWVVYESMQKAETIFLNNELPVGEGGVTWDNKTLDDFQNMQDQLVEEGKYLASIDNSGALTPYFHNLTAVLQQQDGASCGWMALRRDLIRVLKSALHNHRACLTWRHAH